MGNHLIEDSRLFFINLNAGKGLSSKEINILKNEISSFGRSAYLVISKSRSHTESEVRRFLKQGGKEIVAIGGDGTINSIVNSLCSYSLNHQIKKTALCVGHHGTGNDYFRSLVLNKKEKNWKTILRNGKKSDVDVGKITFKENKEVRYFVNMASIGISPEIVRAKEGLPHWVPSKLKYIIPSIKTFLFFKAFNITVVIDGKESHYKAKAVTFSKGSFAGGGMRFGENVKLDDGKFEVTVFEDMNPLVMIYHFAKLFSYRKSIKGVKKIHKLYSSQIEIKSDEKISVEFDGELYGSTDLKVEVCSKILRIFRPTV